MIYTSSHNNIKSNKYRTISISGNRGRDANYIGECYPKLAPKLTFWKIWHENIGRIPEIENNKYYINEYYNQVLSNLDIEEVYKELDSSILLCYEDNNLFCHRHIVASYFELMLGVDVYEVKEEDKLKIMDRPLYIKEYLEEVIKKENIKVKTQTKKV